ncbi:phenylalanine--tRNA ligase subunit beta [Gayadomonas joobiniege]|uniref:phenylalanine--tRNA ligase subunit beta n=1 Tax=Gayadomonas joobiniege TaxID=1234606 RepID=UPI0003605665|nr:phenylalanine--tRNA ligase subunit beta [Gayadomonas joobiniege]
MKFSESWLREWVNPNISRAELVEQITMAGLEVDEVTPAAAEFSGVLVGHVVECGPHPDAEKLQVTKIDVGADELLDIVCGAKNCRQGLKVAVATVGAVLPGNFKIKKAKLRGVASFGMLCSEAELGMLDEAPGIMELPEDAKVGTDVRELLQLDDACIEVDLTPNRADCLSIAGLAREVGVLNNTDVKAVQVAPVAASIDDSPEVELLAPDACAKYAGRIIKGINIKAKSPLWLVEKLRRSGIRSIDPVVDVTNFVMLELGQPMHAFDLAKVEQKICVRYANENEKLTLLDGQEVNLSTDTLVIADANKALALAGVFGGKDSGVGSQTQDILLESAFFSPDYMMGKARQYGLHTDSSHRFERGVDASIQIQAIERASQLIIEICGGEAGPVTLKEQAEKLPAERQLTLRKEKLDARIGVNFAIDQVTEMLARLGLKPQQNEQGWTVIVPDYRFDIAIEVDLIEEVARIYGYNNIPNVAPVGALKMAAHSEQKISLNSVKHQLAALGYQEAITYSFVDPKAQKALHPDIDALILPHPISADMSAMRVSHLTGLLNSVIYNVNRQQNRVRLFESGLKFIPDNTAENGIRQTNVLSGVITGLKHGEHWSLDKTPVDFYDLKGDVEQVLAKIDLSASYEFKIQSHTALHPGQSAAIYKNNEYLGFIGAVHPQAAKDIGLKTKAFVFELNIDVLLNKQMIQAKPVSKFPSNRRDLAFIVDKQTELGTILKEIENLGANQLVELNLFDVYQGEGIQDDKKSFAVSLIIQDVDKTLEEKEISAITDKIIAQLESKFAATLRD